MTDESWPAERIELLRTLWAGAMSTAAIGRYMGISKNAVLGKAHRLNLPARPSPIRRATAESPRQTRPSRAGKRWLPPVPSQPDQAPLAQNSRPAATEAELECRFPTSAGRPWTFCGHETVPGSSYCLAHHTLCRVPTPRMRDAVRV